MRETLWKSQFILSIINGSKGDSISKSQMKQCTSLSSKGIIHLEFIPQGQTVNEPYYVEILKRLRDAVRRKRPEPWPNDWILHHDNAPSHKAFSVKQFLTKKPITEMEY
jgi:hypothetical protein